MASATLFAIFLLSALTFYPPSTTAQPVLDEYGNNATNGGLFYILPLFTGAGGGGIERARTGDEASPLSIVQSPYESDPGQQWRIKSIYDTSYIQEGKVHISYDISYDYVQRSDIFASNEWVVVNIFHVGALVKVGYPDPFIGGYFAIHRASSDHTYKFQWCSYEHMDGPCYDVGIIHDEARNKVLALNQGTLFEFVLRELHSTVSK